MFPFNDFKYAYKSFTKNNVSRLFSFDTIIRCEFFEICNFNDFKNLALTIIVLLVFSIFNLLVTASTIQSSIPLSYWRYLKWSVL